MQSMMKRKYYYAMKNIQVREFIPREKKKTTISQISSLDLALLYKLVSRVPNATTKLKQIVEEHIREMGIGAIERASSTAINVKINDSCLSSNESSSI